MFVWFVGVGLALVWSLFRSPALDYRLVALGTVLPLADALTGGAWVLHTLVASVAALLVVMLLTRRRRLARRRWLGLPIGMFVHLVLDGVWSSAHLFWWPLFGWSFEDKRLPEVTRGLGLDVVLEVIGAIALVWFVRRFDLADAANRQRFLHTGQLPRDRVG